MQEVDSKSKLLKKVRDSPIKMPPPSKFEAAAALASSRSLEGVYKPPSLKAFDLNLNGKANKITYKINETPRMLQRNVKYFGDGEI